MSETTRILKHARSLVRRGWCQSADARNKTNRSVNYLSPKAVKFCISGALDRAATQIEGHISGKAHRLLRKGIPIKYRTYVGVIAYNDHFCKSRKQALEVFNRAIQKAT